MKKFEEKKKHKTDAETGKLRGLLARTRVSGKEVGKKMSISASAVNQWIRGECSNGYLDSNFRSIVAEIVKDKAVKKSQRVG